MPLEQPDDFATVNPASPEQPDPAAQPESPAALELRAGPQWPRQVEPETDEAWEAMGIPRQQIEAAKPVETIEQRVKQQKARRSAILFEPESSQYALVACESEISLDSTGGSSWNITIGPPSRDIKTGAKGEVLLFPNGSYVPEPGFKPVGGYHSPL